MLYPKLNDEHFAQMQYIKNRYTYLLTHMNNAKTRLQKQFRKHEMLELDEERTRLYLQHIQPNFKPQPATYER